MLILLSKFLVFLLLLLLQGNKKKPRAKAVKLFGTTRIATTDSFLDRCKTPRARAKSDDAKYFFVLFFFESLSLSLQILFEARFQIFCCFFVCTQQTHTHTEVGFNWSNIFFFLLFQLERTNTKEHKRSEFASKRRVVVFGASFLLLLLLFSLASRCCCLLLLLLIKQK